MKRNTITIIELIIILCVIVVAVRVWGYKKPPKQISTNAHRDSTRQVPYNGDMVLIEGCPRGDFYIGTYEVTNKEYSQYDPSHKNPGDNLPVVDVTWDDAANYCKWLSKKTGKNYRLPVDQEWKYAYMAGTITKYYWGDNMDGSYCWYKDNSGGKFHPVGQKKPNAWGLYDMSGNVWEWCSDGDDKAMYRPIYGGCWEDGNGEYFQSSFRGLNLPNDKNIYLGFRVAMTP